MKVAFLGIRCIPARFGGGDTEAEETAVRLVNMDVDIIAYVRKKYYEGKKLTTYKGIILIYTPTFESKNLGTPIHTFLSIIHMWLRRVKPDLIHVRGIGNALFIPMLIPFGVPIIQSLDGKDWEREKWGWFAKRILLLSAKIGFKYSDVVTVDSEVNRGHYEEKFGSRPKYLSYGTNLLDEPDLQILNKYGLKKDNYLLWVGIYKPEKNIKILIKSFENVITDKKLLLIGRVDEYERYFNECKETSDSRIIFQEPIYGKDINSIYSGEFLYCQPSLVEGTSPSLLTAMGAGTCVVVSNIPENLETVADAGVSFMDNDAEDLTKKLQALLEDPESAVSHGKDCLDRVKKYYNWDRVAEQTMKLYENSIISRRR